VVQQYPAELAQKILEEIQILMSGKSNEEYIINIFETADPESFDLRISSKKYP